MPNDDHHPDDARPVHLAVALTAAWLASHGTRAQADDVSAFLCRMHGAVLELRTGDRPTTLKPVEEPGEHVLAVSVRKSLASPDRIISMIDGKPYRTLKKHLATNGLTPAEYRARYGLKADYPMVAPAFSASRREMAHRIGLGRKKQVDPVADDALPAGDGMPPLDHDETLEEGATSAMQDDAATAPTAPRRKLKLAMTS